MSSTILDRAAIAARIPHAGRMCLLDRVLGWDEDGIVCESDDPLQVSDAPGHGAANPLTQPGGLPASAAIEYAAQAMALHGALIAERAAPTRPTAEPARGFLAGLRTIRLGCRWVPPDTTGLRIRARRFAGDALQVIYEFDVDAGGADDGQRPIASGRAIVILDAERRSLA